MKKFICLFMFILLTTIMPSFAQDVNFTPDQMSLYGAAQNGGGSIGYLDNAGSGFFVTYTSPQRQWATVNLINFNAKDQVANITEKIIVNNQEICIFTNNNPEYTTFSAGRILLSEGVNVIKIDTISAINWVNYQGLVLTNFETDETAYTTYEAENATLFGGVSINSNHIGYNGTGFVDNLGTADGTGVSFFVNANYEGEYTLDFRYASISSQKISLYINGDKISQVNLPTTSEGSSSWDIWGTWSTKVFLKQGENNITFKRDIEDYTQLNMDSITLSETIGALKAKLTEAQALVESNYIYGWETFQSTLIAGQELVNGPVTEQEAEDAVTAINNSMNGLVLNYQTKAVSFDNFNKTAWGEGNSAGNKTSVDFIVGKGYTINLSVKVDKALGRSTIELKNETGTIIATKKVDCFFVTESWVDVAFTVPSKGKYTLEITADGSNYSQIEDVQFIEGLGTTTAGNSIVFEGVVINGEAI